MGRCPTGRQSCILSKFYIKPQRNQRLIAMLRRCILSKFYIKPQPSYPNFAVDFVVSYRNSTSNHNISRSNVGNGGLYLIEILHQTTTMLLCQVVLPLLYLIEILHQTTTGHGQGFHRIMLYLIEILHQTTTYLRITPKSKKLYLIEILHQTTTGRPEISHARRLYLIEILHQTTTSVAYLCAPTSLYLIEILHQTTTCPSVAYGSLCCILSKFYIKPQREPHYYGLSIVVSYRNSTSNHNGCTAGVAPAGVVSYRNSTSNHNSEHDRYVVSEVVSYRNSTSNHNQERHTPVRFWSCILSKFYIKPQHC